MFLIFDIYFEYVRSGGENIVYMSNGGFGSLKVVCGYFFILNEEEEWICVDFKCKFLLIVVGLFSKILRVMVSVRFMEIVDSGYRFFKRSDFVNFYYVGFGYVFVLVISVNDSEIFSDVLMDDFMFMMDSSVDGIFFYCVGSKK